MNSNTNVIDLTKREKIYTNIWTGIRKHDYKHQYLSHTVVWILTKQVLTLLTLTDFLKYLGGCLNYKAVLETQKIVSLISKSPKENTS